MSDALIKKGENRKVLNAKKQSEYAGSGGVLYEKGLNRSKEKNRGGFAGGVEYTAKQAGLSFLRVGEGVLDAALVPIDLITLNGDRAASRFQNSRVEQRQRELQREYNPGKGMEFIGSVTGGMGQSVGNALISAIPYAGKPMMYSSIIEQSISSAADKTGKVGAKEIAYGTTVGVVEAILEEKLGSGVKGVKTLGSAILKKTGKNVVKSAAKAGGKSAAKAVATEIAKGAAGEFAEEAISEAVDPVLQRLYGIDKNASTSFKDIMYAGVVGGVSGGLISAGPAVINYNSAVSAGRSIQERGLDKDLIKRAKETVNGLKKAQADVDARANAESAEGETSEARRKRKKIARQARRFSKETKNLIDKIEKNIAAYEELMADPNKDRSSVAAAVLGELRGNIFLAAASSNIDVIESVMMAADDKNRQLFVDAINERLAADGNEKHDHTLADFDADKDHIRRRLAGELALEDMLGIAVEDGEEATQEATEASTSPWEGLADNEDMSGYNAAGEAENALLKAAVRESVPRGSVQAMLDEFRKGTDMTPEEFAAGWSDGAHIYGRYGLNVDEASPLSRMSPEAREAAMKFGRETEEAERKTREEKAKAKKKPAAQAGKKGTVVRGEGLNVQKLSDEQYAAYKAAEVLAEVLGTEIVIETAITDKKGRTVNGYYDTKTNRLHVNINAMRDGKNISLYTLGHEVTHYIKEWSPTKFEALADFVLDQMGVDAETAVAEKLASLKRLGIVTDTMTIAEANALAREELVAEGMELVLTDGKVLEELSKTDKTLWEKIRDWIADVIDKIRKHYGELNQASKTAQVLKETVESLEEIERMFTEGVKEAGERTRTAGVETETRVEGEKIYSTNSRYDFTKSFGEQVDDYINGRFPDRDALLLGVTPEIYQKIGFNALPMTINQEHVDYAVNNTKDEDHYLGEALLKQLPQKIKEPVAVFVSQTQKETSVVALLKFTVNGKQVIAPIIIDGSGRQNGIRIDSNVIKTVFGKDNAISKQLMDAIINDADGKFALLYNNKKEAMTLLQGAGLQLPRGLIPRDGFLHSIREKESPVKPKFENVTESQQFKNWFGDWEKHPNTASKVVNADGTPKIVYHQTGADFTVFNTDNPAAGKYDSETPNGIFFKDNDHDIGFTGKKQMAVYLSIRKPLRFSNREEANRWYKTNIKGYSKIHDEYDKAMKAFDPRLKEIEKEQFDPKTTDERYDELDRMEESLIEDMKVVEDGYRAKLRALLDDYFIGGKSGYDGIELAYDGHRWVNGKRENVHTYIVFDRNQIKSATDNIGTFDSNNPDIRYSLGENTDETYLSAVERDDVETAQRMVDEAAKAAGYVNLFYHGAKKGGGFTVFRDWSYFTENKAYAERYTDREKTGSLYKTYVKMDNTFDTRKAKDRKLFAEIRDEYGLGEIQDTGLPDWTDGYDISDYIDENDLDYDSIVLDEGGDLVDGVPISRGLSYVVRKSAQIKSADPVTYDDNGNVIPLSERFNKANPDIRYSLGEDTTPNLTDREMLLAMAEQLVGSEEENRIISNYKAQYDTVRTKQNRINELTARQRELQSILFSGDSDAKARSDASKELRTIFDEMNKLLEDVAKVDRKLTEIEGMKVIRNLIQRERLAVRDTYKNKYETMYKRKAEARDTTDTRRSVRRLYNRVNRLIFSPTKTRNVPIGMQGIVAEALRAANVDTEAIERLGQLEEQLAALERDPAPDMAKMADLEQRIEEQERRVGKVKDQVNMLIEIFEATNDQDADGETRLVFDDVVLQRLKDLRKDIGNASIRNMDQAQLLALKEFYKMIWHRITTANNTLASNRKLEINKVGEQSSREVRDGKPLKILSPKSMELVGAKAARKYIWSILKPLTAFEAIGSDTFMGLFKEVLNGENTWARDLEEAYDVIKASKEKHGYDDWNMIERKTVKTADGDVELSLSEIMSLYAYSFREQAKSHLMGGGFVLDPNATARVKGKKLSFMELERRLNNPTRYTLTEAQIRTLGDYLTDSQRAYVEDVQRYLTDMGEKGNEVSRKLYGIDIFREKHYFPIKVKSEYLESQTGKTGDPKIKNRGMTKEIVPEAKNPLVLQDFMAVAGDHINSMATYHAFVLPVEDLTRVLNFKPTNVKLDKDGNPILDENGMPVADTDATVKYDTLKSEIEAKYGAEAVSYIEQMIRDLNGGARRDAAATLLDQGLTAFKRATTMLSLSTIIQQPTSIFRAMAYVDAKWFTGAKMYDYDVIKKYAPVAIMKEIGGFDTGTGIRTAEYLNSKEYKTFKDKIKAIALQEAYGGDPAYRAEAFGWLTGKADEITWRYMFGAIVNEQAAKLGKPADSEAVLKAAGERFSDVVRRTQVYDSTLTRSEIMRSKDTGAKLLTQFAAEPTTVVSMIVDGLIKAERGDKAFFRKTAAAVATSIIINAMASSLIYAMRDDDEDKNLIEKYISSLTGELIEGFNPLEYLPFFRDIMSIFKGYDVERSDMTLIGNLFDQIELITSSKRSFADKLFGVTGAVTAFFGVPVTNVYRDVKGVITTGASFVDSEPVTGRGMGGAVNEGVKSQYSLIYKLFGAEEGNAYELYKAAVSGDTAHYDRVAARYASASAAEQALRKELRENDRRIAEAAEAKASGELDVYESIIDKIEAEGHFDRNLIIRAINNEVLELRDAANQATAAKDENPETEDEETADEALYTATDLTDAMERGDTDDYAAVYDYLLTYKVEQGQTEAQAKSSIKSSVTAKYKRLYLAAWEQNDTAAMKRILALLEQTGLYGSYNDTAKTVEKWVRESAN